MLYSSDLEVGRVLQRVHSMSGLKTINLQIHPDLDICLLIISWGWGENSGSVEGILSFLPLAPTGVQGCQPGKKEEKQILKRVGTLEDVLALSHVQSRYSVNISSK